MFSRQRVALLVVLIASASWYTYGLDRAPVYLGDDEAHFAIGGAAIAKNGRNVNGDRLPLFFNLADPFGDPVKMPWGDTWFHPMLFYLIAVVLKVQPLSETTARLPVALIGGLLTPLLLYAAARKLRFGYSGAIAAAIAVVLAPAHYILSREALDYTMLLPFAVGWVWLLADYLETRRIRSAAILGLVLGIGCYSYIAAWGVMPFLLGVAWLAFWRGGAGWWRAVAASGAAFAPAPIILIAWLSYHPAVIGETTERYRILETTRAAADQDRMANIRAAAPGYASYYGWDFLFRHGAPNVKMSTDMIGVFLLPVAVLFPIGLAALVRRKDPIPSWPIVAALLFAPLPAALSGHAEAIQRATLILPFASLVVGAGFGALWRSRITAWRVAALLMVAAAPFQLVPFVQDYFTLHRNRSAFYFDPIAFGDVTEHITRLPNVPAVFLRRNLDAAPARWRFHLTKAGREDLLARSFYVSGLGEASAGPVDSRMIAYVEGELIAAATASGLWSVDVIIRDIDQREAAVILRKVR